MSSNNNPKQVIAWFVVLLILGVTLWSGSKALREAKPEEAPAGPAGGRPPSTVIFQPAAEKEVVQLLTVTGTLRAARRAQVASREAAAVDSIEVSEGDLVEKGATLVTLDGRRIAAQLAEGQASLTAARAELAQREAEDDRAKEDAEMMSGLWDQKAIAKRQYLDSVSAAKVANSRVDAAREAIDASHKRLELLKVREVDLKVSAPFDGRVVARHTEIGEWLKEGDPVVTLVSTGEVEAWLQLPERHAAQLKTTTPGSVEIRLPGRDEPIRADKMSLISDVEGRSRRFNLIAHIPDPENTLTPGTSVEAIVPIGEPTIAIVVSSDAVLKSYAGTYVFIAAPGEQGPPVATRVPIEVQFERDGEAVLAPGELKLGDQVIVEGNERLFPNTPLNPQPFSTTRGEKPKP
ncbi:MAG: RND family efflux transporter MFP subunit [Verrucomicrobiales bacterium]|jgi:RND family efflux transporter MFP subunit